MAEENNQSAGKATPRRSFIYSGVAAASIAVLLGASPSIGKSADGVAPSTTQSAPATSATTLVADGDVRIDDEYLAVAARNSSAMMRGITFSVAKGILVADVYYDFLGNAKDAEAIIRLQVISSDNKILGEQTVRQQKRVEIVPERHGNTVYDTIYVRIAKVRFANISVPDVARFHLELETK